MIAAVSVAGCGGDSSSGPDHPDSAVVVDHCSFENCSGCCDGDTCVTGTDVDACGARGAACATCAGDETCTAGQCVPVADCSDCDGCCLNGTQCLPGNSPDACGRGGAACETCGTGEGCDLDTSACEAITCDATTCPDGCCTANGVCLIYGEQTIDACGKAGAACETCSPGASTCSAGTCVLDQPCLDYCTNGCCTAQGQCIAYADQSASTCGGDTGPEMCMACGTLSCVTGACSADRAWRVSIVSAVIAPTKDGAAWDQTVFTNPLPDPYVGIALADDTFLDWLSPKIDNTLTPTWNYAFGNYNESDLLAQGLLVNIRDSDGLGVYESIGACIVAITPQALQSGTVTQATCGYATNVVISFTDP